MDCFLDKARSHINKALEIDSTVFERTPAQAEAWLLYAKAFAEVDKNRSRFGFS